MDKLFNRSVMTILLSVVLLTSAISALAQPQKVRDQVRFSYTSKEALTVTLVGSFNGWNISANPMKKGDDQSWETFITMVPGSYQYKFLVNGSQWLPDPMNPAKFDDQHGSHNSCLTINDFQQIELRTPSTTAITNTNLKDEYPAGPLVYLNMIWHQHQPLYLDPSKDQLQGPWVRTHGTKDYYDMAAMVQQYPDVHVTINLTTVLLNQLQNYYIDRIRPFVNTQTMTIDTGNFFKKWRGKTDPWIDLALTPSTQFKEKELDYLYRGAWSCFAVSDVIVGRWSEFAALRAKQTSTLTVADYTAIKGFFYLVQFDPEFFEKAVKLPTGVTIDLRDLVDVSGNTDNPQYRLKKTLDEATCNRLVASAVLVMEAIVPMHKQLMYDTSSKSGQIEVITTPYYHPILPLIYDSDFARRCQPSDTLPSRFSAPEDAEMHVKLAAKAYREWFGKPPSGLWPGEGSVAPEILPILSKYGFRWTASDRQVLSKSEPANQPVAKMYVSGTGTTNVGLVFRDTDLSDRLGFRYQQMDPEAAAEDFIQGVLSYAKDADTAYVTVILDGENAWENYSKDNDGKHTINAIYRKLSKLYQQGRVITATPSEYIDGNIGRKVTAHSLTSLPRLSKLHSGSWIYSSYDTWIGEREENDAWKWLTKVRADLIKAGIKPVDLSLPEPAKDTKPYFERKAWESLMAAEGSDWFWWYGADQNAPGGGDVMFDTGYRTLLENVYRFARLSGANIEVPKIPSLLQSTTPVNQSGGVMQPGERK